MNYPKYTAYTGAPEGYKRCSKCFEFKPLSDFDKRNGVPDGLRYDCRECGKERKKRARDNKSSEKKWDSRLRKNYGITILDWQLLYNKQEGKCLICHKHESELERGLFVDHDHKTDKIRGLLCQGCNLGLGAFRDNPKLLIKAAKYLKSYGKKR